MTTWNVTSATELNDALGSANAGDNIVLADGDYGGFNFNGYKFTDYVTIEAANPLGARFTDTIDIIGSSYLEFDGIHIDIETSTGLYGKILDITNSDHITFKNGEVNGTVDSSYDAYAIYTHTDTSHVTITNNYIHDARLGCYMHGECY